MRKHFGVLISVGGLMAGWSLWAEDWPQWRGPNRDGQIRFTEPKTWPEKLTTKWKITVGEGYASPLLAGGRILQLRVRGMTRWPWRSTRRTGKSSGGRAIRRLTSRFSRRLGMARAPSRHRFTTTGGSTRSASPAFSPASTPRTANSNGGRSTPKNSRPPGRNSERPCRRRSATGCSWRWSAPMTTGRS